MTLTALIGDRAPAIPLLRNLSADESRQLLEIAHNATYQPGDIVLAEDEVSRNLWIVLEGTCEVVKQSDQTGRMVVMAELEPYAHFGEMSFFHPAPHSASVRAKTVVKLLRLGREEFDRLIDGQCAAAYKLAFNTIGGLAERLRRATDRLADLASAAKPASPAKPASEWSSFRDKMLDGWNL
jgi:CRP-like cAMP-binding protein